ncbi:MULTISPECIES: SDR family oxidoreductase [unclassified Leptolyngbya]|uniref:SDR family oxidoreductase n=1 Tax=unclassified Leptolyngbya TaxID=2650499 RepID=UPI00168466E8|nr:MULTISPECIES: SDR family oxidoreductase [unclassified Leptolyngbya]MBD1909207.1 SDR family oxidoreductase [Leptolyngbya sp. FACHB-8]MBD2153990.1 SDR family oxidoreductase [Leptolyngbya sp. FACHB-16]
MQTLPKTTRANQKLADKVVIVTGGARGLGEATCHCLAEAGMKVVVADMRQELATQVAEQIQAQDGTAIALPLDVSSPDNIAKSVDTILETYGKIDVLVNNAGIDITLSVEEMAIDEWQQVINVNLNGPFYMSKAVFPHMREQGGGHIINIVSTAAKRAWANASAYHASKWGLLGLSQALHVEGRLHQIKVTSVIAGGMQTPFLLDRFPDIDVTTLQDPRNVAETIEYLLMQPKETVISEIMVLPMKETSWP